MRNEGEIKTLQSKQELEEFMIDLTKDTEERSTSRNERKMMATMRAYGSMSITGTADTQKSHRTDQRLLRQ